MIPIPFSEAGSMSTTRSRKRPSARRPPATVPKPRGVRHPRVHPPFVTKQYRQPVDPGNKTDDTDLAAMHRATVTGCALLEASRDEAWTTLQLVIRHRRDLVAKGAALNCQIREHLEAALPGFAACFDALWESSIPWHLLRHFPTAEQL